MLDDVAGIFFNQRKDDFSGTYIFACQHILRPRDEMLDIITNFGVPKNNIYILGKKYSTNDRLLGELTEKDYNILQPVHNLKISFDEQHQINCTTLFQKFLSISDNIKRVIILDDGGGLLSVFNDNFDSIPPYIEVIGIEQTSAGYRILSEKKLEFPIYNVARSDVKLTLESPHIAEVCLNKIHNYLNTQATTKRRFLVIGLGNIGSLIYGALKEDGYIVEGFDIKNSNNDTVMDVITSFMPNIIIGATGRVALTKEEVLKLEQLNYEVYFFSTSSSDREFSAADFRDPNRSTFSDIHLNKLVIVNNGYPINFQLNAPKEGIEWIKRTIALLLGATLFSVCLEKIPDHKGFLEIPKVITDKCL